jgi:uncharacterized membrane protein (UPF0127 family)
MQQTMYKLFVVLAAMTFYFTSCNNKQDIRSEASTPPPANQPREESRGNLQKIMVGQTPVWVEIAQDDATRTKGLMFREDMPEDQGMLFIFPVAQRLSFWMKNTYLPLDIAFIDQRGIITDIHQMAPLDTIPRYTSSVPTIYALEVNQGFFARHSINTGDTVKLY